jgi:acetyl-CoA carboxylase biotin carboxyl carrier protein
MSDSNGHNEPTNDLFGLSDVRELLRLIQESDVTEIQIERGDARLHIKRGVAPQAPQYLVTPSLAATLPSGGAALHTYPSPAGVAADMADTDAVPEGLAITSPMVGTFYASPSPKDAAYIAEGDEVQPGDVVGIVEAMKIMNEIESEVAGRVIRVLVTNGQPVEYGQPLMIVEPA